MTYCAGLPLASREEGTNKAKGNLGQTKPPRGIARPALIQAKNKAIGFSITETIKVLPRNIKNSQPLGSPEGAALWRGHWGTTVSLAQASRLRRPLASVPPILFLPPSGEG